MRAVLLAVGLLVSAVATAQSFERWAIANHPAELSLLLSDPRPAWTVRSVEVEELGLADLDVTEVEVFDTASRLLVNDGLGERDELRPSTRFLRGNIRGMAESVVAITVTANGDISGLMTDGSLTWELRQRASDQALEAVTVDTRRGGPSQPFQCGNDTLIEPPELAASRLLTGAPQPAEPLPAGSFYLVKVAIETDYEFYQLMGGSVTQAGNYIGSLFNYISGIYELETQSRLTVGTVHLWSTSSDPWVETSGTECHLYEFGRYWRDNRSSVDRTIAHFLSGRAIGRGIAWLDQLCRPPATYNLSTGCASVGNDLVIGGFAVSAGLTGTIQNASGIAWDAIVVAHEIGHNFVSPHTHCYAGYAGIANPVDACWGTESGSACWAGATSLPGVNSLTGGTSGGQNGTIMSYCQQRTGGIGNIAGTFGMSHPFGVQPDRVPTRMFDRVALVAASNSACIPVVSVNPELTVSKAGNGTVTSSPAGINCGSTCSASFASGTSVTLTATPATSWSFAGWGGDCAGTGTCTVSMTAARNVGATFVQSLNNGQAVSNLSGAQGSSQYFVIDVPSGATNLVIQTSGGSGDVDLYVRLGSMPTTGAYDCSSYAPDNNESCSTAKPVAGRYYIMLNGFAAYSGVTLQASYVFTTYALTVAKTGTGSGTVTSNPAGINCSSTCSANYAASTSVTLTATAAAGSTFAGWSGACTGTGTCTVTMNGATSVTARFGIPGLSSTLVPQWLMLLLGEDQ